MCKFVLFDSKLFECLLVLEGRVLTLSRNHLIETRHFLVTDYDSNRTVWEL